ncbi:MAG: twin-arginine translocase subunit TatC [Candidatus Dactylopiibacterium carminicum]|uniref:Sec-independent protein translocase protein TatC n=1 Tax=Candidatus Dactylopiibacterium carminicum TaxID=857335 RepID=A0A272EWB0_9RHOO|nr:twin-arginine translocase subunit TatC [Candidatus Dactylopiibacterium carminicum]KAF7599839.1 twin-arginine translocase subunit TatC [Candidatus Dactylopiibacterium carminicum]PAS93950.1 MAG: twin-arginine translocase subunit TatC [Candidatus Dactylopiibacterium carminicum]PAS97265.1 MAG: twin-arginine translocase subunit TatC [Candidatus Dactylopiibacterium carminicum]PAS99839.1 MAG: twin arginine-targeting protein translocase TatC [Candidatus Dactylopiibacterium carminicum]
MEQESFISHLVELRNRLIYSLLAVLAVFLCLVWWAKDLYSLLAAPLLAVLPQGGQMIATDVVGVFLVPMKVTAWVSLLIAMPFVLYQAWAFVAPGLYAHERRLALPLLVSSCVLFVLGMCFAYFVFFPGMFKVMTSFTPEGVAWMTDIDKYLGFVMGMFLAFGAAFEVPVVVVLLVLLGVVDTRKLAAARRYVIVGAFVVAAVVTPPDVASQFMLAVPMCLLFEVGLLVGRLIERRQSSD